MVIAIYYKNDHNGKTSNLNLPYLSAKISATLSLKF